jgi:hypothetical protein
LNRASWCPPSSGWRPYALNEARRGECFWAILLHNNGCALRDAPSNKLVCRGETRYHRKSLGHERDTHARCVHRPIRFTGNLQEEFSIHKIKLSGQNHGFYMIRSFPRHSRHFLSGIYLGLVSDGSPLLTGGDDDWCGFGLAHSPMSSDAVGQLI